MPVSVSFVVYVCLCVARIHVCVGVSSFACGCRCVWVFTYVEARDQHQLSSSVDVHPGSWVKVSHLSKASCSMGFRDPFLLPPVLRLLTCATMPGFCVDFEDLSLDPCACPEGTWTANPSFLATIWVCFYRAVSFLQVIFSSFLLSNHFTDNWFSESLQ